jgi:ribonuclease HII
MIGIDEVGRGCWAGPLLVVAARQTGQLIDGLADSKTLSKNQRESIFPLLSSSIQFGEGWVQPEEIDQYGLAGAMRIGVTRALLQLDAQNDEEIIMDGTINYCPDEFTHVTTMAKADQTEPIVSAASIYAKVTRDRHMHRVARFHPFYGFEQHVGYGTALHMSALKVHGVSAIHRRSFKPISELLAVQI